MVSESQSRLIVNINDLRRRNEKRAKESVNLLRVFLWIENVMWLNWLVCLSVFLLIFIPQSVSNASYFNQKSNILSSIEWYWFCVFNRLLKNAFSEQIAFQRALKDLVASIDATYAKQFDEFHVGFEGSFGNKHVSPRTLSARLLGNLVCVEGIVTKCK